MHSQHVDALERSRLMSMRIQWALSCCVLVRVPRCVAFVLRASVAVPGPLGVPGGLDPLGFLPLVVGAPPTSNSRSLQSPLLHPSALDGVPSSSQLPFHHSVLLPSRPPYYVQWPELLRSPPYVGCPHNARGVGFLLAHLPSRRVLRVAVGGVAS